MKHIKLLIIIIVSLSLLSCNALEGKNVKIKEYPNKDINEPSYTDESDHNEQIEKEDNKEVEQEVSIKIDTFISNYFSIINKEESLDKLKDLVFNYDQLYKINKQVDNYLVSLFNEEYNNINDFDYSIDIIENAIDNLYNVTITTSYLYGDNKMDYSTEYLTLSVEEEIKLIIYPEVMFTDNLLIYNNSINNTYPIVNMFIEAIKVINGQTLELDEDDYKLTIKFKNKSEFTYKFESKRNSYLVIELMDGNILYKEFNDIKFESKDGELFAEINFVTNMLDNEISNNLIKYVYLKNIVTESDSITNILLFSQENYDFNEKYNELNQ